MTLLGRRDVLQRGVRHRRTIRYVACSIVGDSSKRVRMNGLHRIPCEPVQWGCDVDSSNVCVEAMWYRQQRTHRAQDMQNFESCCSRWAAPYPQALASPYIISRQGSRVSPWWSCMVRMGFKLGRRRSMIYLLFHVIAFLRQSPLFLQRLLEAASRLCPHFQDRNLRSFG